MNKALFLGVFMLLSLATFAQPGSQKVPGKAPQDINESDIMFIAFKATDKAFPVDAFTMANADYFISTVRSWISADLSRYTIATNEKTKNASEYIIFKNSHYYTLSAEKQAVFKEWAKNIERFLAMQNSFQSETTKRYLLSKGDFEFLLSLLEK